MSIEVTIAREGPDLAWQVENVGLEDVWAYLLVPSIEGGRLTFDSDNAWLGSAGEDTLVARKVDASALPSAALRETVPSGAVRLGAGQRRSGRLLLGPEVEARSAVRQVVLEVGWVPWRPGECPPPLQWKGQPFAYVRPDAQPGGQRFTRSAPLAWAAPTSGAAAS